jgi:hypothetical protein
MPRILEKSPVPPGQVTFRVGRWRKATVLANVSGVLSRHAMESVQFRQVSLHSSCWTGKSLFNYMAMPWDTQKCLK